MKTILLLLLIPLAAAAQQVGIQWPASPDTNVTHYILRAHTNALASTNLSAAIVRLNVGTNLTARLADLAPATWHLRVTAAVAIGGVSVESQPSDEVTFYVPAPVVADVKLFVEANVLDVSKLTGWTNLGFFRLKLGN